MTSHIPAHHRTKVQQPRFLVPGSPKQRLPDMLTDQQEEKAEADHNRRLHQRDSIISRLMEKLDEKEDEFGRYELDNAIPVLVTEDSAGNARVRRQS